MTPKQEVLNDSQLLFYDFFCQLKNKPCSNMLSFYYCKKCSFSAKNLKGLDLHQLEVHRFCQICDYTSENSEEFFNHIGKNHSEVKIYECDVFCKFS